MTSLGEWVTSARAHTAALVHHPATPAPLVHHPATPPRGARKSFSVMVVTVTAMAAAGLTAAAVAGPAGAAHHHAAGSGPAGDETTASQNNLRDGWDPNEPALTRAAVGGGKFGQIFKTAVHGQVYAQPLVVGNIVIVATEDDRVYGLNATTGAIRWKTSLGTPYHITTCKDLTPNIGITSAPVYDPNTASVYVMAMVKETNWGYRLYGLDVSTGAITLKKLISGSPTNDRHISFHPIPQDQRTGLLLLNGWVFAGFASHCDNTPYAGYVAGVNVEQRPVKSTLWTDEAGASDDRAGIWQSQGGLVSDGAGRIFFTSGNGISPAKGPGDRPPGQLAESVVRLQPQSDGSLKAVDFFSPAKAPKLDAGDKDFGSGGPVGLPFGTKTYPDVLAQAGKYGRLYLINRDNLGGRQQNSAGRDLFETGHLAGLWGSPGVFGDTTTLSAGNAAKSHDYLYYVGKNDYLRAFKVGVNGSDEPTLTERANSTFRFGFGSGSPVVTSNGTDPNSAIIWVIDSPDTTGDGKNAWLGAFDATPRPKAGGGIRMREIWSGTIGTAAKFSTAATANGMVYVGTRDGDVYGFGITSGAALASGGTATFADTPVHSASTTAATVTATRTVTVTAASAKALTATGTPDPFTISRVAVTRHGGGTAAVKFPVTLRKGDVLRAQVKFAPGAVGGASGAVAFTTGARPAGKVAVPLVGDGTQAGLFATYPSLSFVLNTNDGVISNVPVGINVWAETSIVNGSDTPLRVTSVKAPAGQYTVAGLPAPGTVIKPGEAISVQGEFTPTRIGAANSSFTITTNRGQTLTVTMTGTGLKPVTRFASVPARVNFGSVQVGHAKKVWIDITNEGNQSALMSGGATQGAPFHAQFSITRGLPVNSADDLTVPIIFTPHKAGPFHGLYKVTWRDATGSHSLEVPISGTGVG